MSRVFLAEETRFHRKVVVKVLSPELAAGVNTARFEREISLAAGLQQAQIVPVITAGQVESLPWYSMPYVEGESLRARLAQGPISVTESIAILRDVARALAYAHEHGVVHRDIKPDNVLLSGGSAVVTDFGIAKAVSLSMTEGGQERLTLTGSGLGTPAYMPPEQAAGDDKADHRADIYSFGCLAYEILTGKPPFAGMSPQQMIAAHFQKTPDPVRNVRVDVPLHISTLIAHCLEKDPERRPQTARELLQALNQDAEVMSASRRTRMGVIGGVVAALLLVAIVTVVARRGGGGGSAAPTVRSLAVLPFANVGGDSAQEYLADGIRDELATALGKGAGVRIIGRSAAFQFRGRRDLDVRQVGRVLGARYLLQGTLRQTSGRLRVSAQLSDSASGAELWADTFDGSPGDLAAVTDGIVRSVRGALNPAAASRASSRQTSSPEAYDLYLRGEFLLQRRGAGVEGSVQNFSKAIAVDSQFARAWAGLSAAYALFPYFNGTSPMELEERVESPARRALALDSTLAEPHVSLGLSYWHTGRTAEAETEMKRAIALDDNDLNAHLQYGRFLLSEGRLKDALEQLTRAKTIDPVSPIASIWAAYAQYGLGDVAGALAEAERARQIDSTMLPVANFSASLNLLMKRKDRARAVMSHVTIGNTMSYAPYVLAATGDSAKAFAALSAMEHRPVRPWFIDAEYASVYLALGDTARGLTSLERSANLISNSWTLFVPVTDPIYDSVRESPRFAALVRKAKLDPARFAVPGGGRGR